jgi:hypothetical protein
VKTLDLWVAMGHHQEVASSSEPGSGVHSLSIRADADLAADRGSPAAALALLTAAAEDIEPRAPLDAAVLLAEASFHALLSHGPARALELARSAAEVIGGEGTSDPARRADFAARRGRADKQGDRPAASHQH